jgi:inhibitor of KinA
MFTFFPLGDSAFIVKVGNSISIENHKLVRAFTIQVEKAGINGVIEVIPAYCEVTIVYNPLIINHKKLLEHLKIIESETTTFALPPAQIIHIPVCYEPPFASDIGVVAKSNKLSIENVVNFHCSVKYLVYMLGFTPGFCYLGGMDERLSTPRKETPSPRIEAGSVGIAGNQTGIYPIDSPGGWQIIGKTPLKLFDPNRKPEFLIEAGNFITFFPITRKAYDYIRKQIEAGQYEIKKGLANG